MKAVPLPLSCTAVITKLLIDRTVIESSENGVVPGNNITTPQIPQTSKQAEASGPPGTPAWRSSPRHPGEALDTSGLIELQ